MANDDRVANAGKVGMPIGLHCRHDPAIGAFHLNPQTPGRNEEIWHASTNAFDLEPGARRAASSLAIGNGKDPHWFVGLAKPADKLALFNVFRTRGLAPTGD
jgi:hypothetical protein